MEPVALDWPLTTKEKTRRLVQLQEDAITELSSDPAVVKSVSDAIQRAKQMNVDEHAEKEEQHLPMTPPKDRSGKSSPDGNMHRLSDRSDQSLDSVVKNLHRLSDRSDSSQEGNVLAVDPALLQEALVALSKLCAVAANPKKERDDEDEPLNVSIDTQRKSRSQPCRTSQPSALQKKRNSRGPNTPRVRFADLENSDDDVLEGSAKARGRNLRRVSRGPDGKTYDVSESRPKKQLAGPTSTAIATAAATAVASSENQYKGFYAASSEATAADSGQRTRRVWRKPGGKAQPK